MSAVAVPLTSGHNDGAAPRMTESLRSNLRSLAAWEASSSSATLDGLQTLIDRARTTHRRAIAFTDQETLLANTLRRHFPPPPTLSSTGFTFFASFKLPALRDGADLLHVFDAAAQRSCSVKLSVEPVTGLLKYSSGLRHATLHFPDAVLEEGRWHHVCLIHRRPRGDSRACRVELYLDGELKHEFNNAIWPSAPPPGGRVRAIVGSPTGWQLSSAYLMDTALPPDIPVILADLASSGYNGNFQDSLGRFMTYATSAKVNLTLSRATSITASQEAVVQVITGSASDVFPEDRFYLMFNAADDRVLRRTVAEESLADEVWRLGGFALLLRMIEQSYDAQKLERSLTLFFALVGSSWRLSEEVELSRGYEVLNYLVTQKRHLIDLPILHAFARAVGLEDDHAADRTQANGERAESAAHTATLVNPFLFRVCMLDFQLWAGTGAASDSTAATNLQIAHLDIINTFLRTSRHRRFNAKRVTKMQITRKILYALSTFDNVQSDDRQAMLAVEFVSTLRTSLVATFNDVAIRNVSSYLVTQLCRSPYERRGGESENDIGAVDNTNAAAAQGRVSNKEAALMVFEMLADLVRERPPFLRKFGSVINIRWLRIFVSLTSEPRASRLALDIMAALVSHDQKYAEQHGNSGSITERRMRLWYDSLRAVEEGRCTRIRLDVREATASAARQWHTTLLPGLLRERAALGQRPGSAERTFELDPTEGLLRMRPKLREARAVWEGETSDVSARASPTAGATEASSKRLTLPPQPNSKLLSQDEAASPLVEATHKLDMSEDSAVEVPAMTSPADASQITSNTIPTVASESADTHDDKYRRIVRSLERGDVIEGVENSLRVVFIECRASLLIFGQRCFYIIDDYFQRPDGELCNVWEAPEEERDTIVMSTLSTTGGSGGSGGAAAAMTLVHQLEGEQQETRRWKWSELQLITMKTFLHRRTAIEIAFTDGHTCLLVLATTAQASAVYNTLASRNRAAAQAFTNLCNGVRAGSGSGNTGDAASPGGDGSSVAKANGPRFSGSGVFRLTDAVLGRGAGGMGAITRRWVERKMSNFVYLMCLNTASGRTYQDITQYPIMPFVLRDYSSAHLDLSDPASFRDLSLPMGAQVESRRRQFRERYEQLAEMYEAESDPSAATKPFHYGTHYSTAATVSGFLIRLRPFDKIVKALQGGAFDLPDRTFSSIGHAYASAAEGSLGDVRELIPEAYYMPDFLVNGSHFDFGQTQAGVTINDVELPPWAKGNARLFIKMHRDALESEHVSQHLHAWIDLVFGYKQRGAAAVAATNCFHELSYDDGGLDLHAIESPIERQAVLRTIHMFGVCPRPLFTLAPHPRRQTISATNGALTASGASTESVARTPWLLIQSITPLRTLKQSAVHFIYLDAAGSIAKAFSSPRDYLILPHVGLSLSLGHLDGSIRFFARDDMQAVKGVAEQVLAEQATCLVDASPYPTPSIGGAASATTKRARVLIGGQAGSLIACELKPSTCELTFLYACRGHTDRIAALDHSHAWSLTVSGSYDGSAIVWDNQGAYVKTLEHSTNDEAKAVQCVRISRSNGLIATTCGPTLYIWSINGDAIASIETGATSQDSVSSLTFYEGSSAAMSSCDDEQQSLCMLFTGHRGKVIGWRCVPDYDRPRKSSTGWRLEPFHVSEHNDRFDVHPGLHRMPLVTALLFTGDTLLSGDEHGRLYAWWLPGRSTPLDGSGSHAAGTLSSPNGGCMQCNRKAGLFEKRTWCASCGGIFCTASCLFTLAGSPFGAHRYCRSCRDHLSMLVSKSPRVA